MFYLTVGFSHAWWILSFCNQILIHFIILHPISILSIQKACRASVRKYHELPMFLGRGTWLGVMGFWCFQKCTWNERTNVSRIPSKTTWISTVNGTKMIMNSHGFHDFPKRSTPFEKYSFWVSCRNVKVNMFSTRILRIISRVLLH